VYLVVIHPLLRCCATTPKTRPDQAGFYLPATIHHRTSVCIRIVAIADRQHAGSGLISYRLTALQQAGTAALVNFWFLAFLGTCRHCIIP
jgi:hypothetical protein